MELGKEIGEEIKKILLDDEFYKFFADECEENLSKAHSDKTLALLGAVVAEDFLVPDGL